VAGCDTILILDDVSSIVEAYLKTLAEPAASAGIRLVAFQADAQARRYVQRQPETIRGFIQDLNRNERQRLNPPHGVVFLEKTIVPLTPWARTAVFSGYGTYESAVRLFEAAPGKVRIFEKSVDFIPSVLREQFAWLIETRDLPSDTAQAAAAVDFQVLSVVEPAWGEVCTEISRSPSLLHNISSTVFEKLAAEIFKSFGYEVEMTATTRDGGFDIIAMRRAVPTDIRVLIQAKRYAPDRAVGVEIIRSLYGIRASNSVSQVVLATTSRVSIPAKREFELVIPWQLDFLERDRILDWCARYNAVTIGGTLSKTGV
jgi:hypothetical protein